MCLVWFRNRKGKTQLNPRSRPKSNPCRPSVPKPSTLSAAQPLTRPTPSSPFPAAQQTNQRQPAQLLSPRWPSAIPRTAHTPPARAPPVSAAPLLPSPTVRTHTSGSSPSPSRAPLFRARRVSSLPVAPLRPCARPRPTGRLSRAPPPSRSLAPRTESSRAVGAIRYPRAAPIPAAYLARFPVVARTPRTPDRFL